MLEVALYIIPPAGSFYDTGSKILGYDIRSQQTVPQYDALQLAWTVTGRQYGFHCSITDALVLPEEKLEAFIAAADETLACFDPTNTYTLTYEAIDSIRKDSPHAALVMLMKPSRTIEMLHDVLVTRLHPLALGTEYSKHPESFTGHEAAKLKLFHAPYIFENFRPHFTCVSDYKGTPSEKMALLPVLGNYFKDSGSLDVDVHSICVVVRRQGEAFFTIAREISLNRQ